MAQHLHHHFNTRLASATVKQQQDTSTVSKKTTKQQQQQHVQTTMPALQKRQLIHTESMSKFIHALVEEESSSLATTNSKPTSKEVENEDVLAAGSSSSSKSSPSLERVLTVAGGVVVTMIALAIYSSGWTLHDITTNVQTLVTTNPQETMSSLIASLPDLGPAAPFYFGVLYFLAELLAIPATPLTLSAGYTFPKTSFGTFKTRRASIGVTVSNSH